ncbi:MAG TPA: 16S rRNA (guanine(527)-N(7))-methyltransferase RsmG [Propionibacteriaceae bacterium]
MSAPARELYGENYGLIARYVELLSTTGVEWGLIGPREVDRLWERHILNCASLSGLIPAGATVADVGSGAGLPGIPLAILRTDLQLSLIEPLLRRSKFLAQAVDDLGITDRVRVVRSRAEDHGGSYDVVTARALAPLGRLVDWCAPLRAPDGVILALKGSSAADEVQQSAQRLARHRLSAGVLVARAHAAAEPATVVRLSAA